MNLQISGAGMSKRPHDHLCIAPKMQFRPTQSHEDQTADVVMFLFSLLLYHLDLRLHASGLVQISQQICCESIFGRSNPSEIAIGLLAPCLLPWDGMIQAASTLATMQAATRLPLHVLVHPARFHPLALYTALCDRHAHPEAQARAHTATHICMCTNARAHKLRLVRDKAMHPLAPGTTERLRSPPTFKHLPFR